MSSVKNSGPFWVYDRREGDLFILVSDGGDTLSFSWLPDGARQGDVFTIKDGRPVPCPQEAEARRRRIKARMERIFGEGK